MKRIVVEIEEDLKKDFKRCVALDDKFNTEKDALNNLIREYVKKSTKNRKVK